MDETSLCEIEIAALTQRLRHLKKLCPSGTLMMNLIPNLCRQTETDHWSFLTFLSHLYVAREAFNEERAVEIENTLNSGIADHTDQNESDEDEDFEWDDDDEWIEEGSHNEEETRSEEKTVDAAASKASANSITSYNA